jgi:hypothetical protein
MKAAFVLVAAAACIPTIQTFPIDAKTEETNLVFGPPLDAARRVVAKLNARGFALVDQRSVDDVVVLVVSGNRDFNGTHTIGSIFYVSIHGSGATSNVKIVGKPTLDHRESCPSITGDPCQSIQVYSKWGVNGYEEYQAIRGVFVELGLELEQVMSRYVTPS